MAETKTTQEFVPIKEVRDGIIIMKDGSMRAIVLVSSLNFSLKSADEQEAIIYQFQNFLNSLDFSVQISIQSRKLDIRPYLNSLQKRYEGELNDLLKIQTKEYIQFVKNFTENQSIMSKAFFVVIPFSPNAFKSSGDNGGVFKKIFSSSADKKADKLNKNDSFEENRTQLEQRLSVVQGGLMRCGIRSASLGTEEAIELFYKLFNPGDNEKPIKL
jgi:type IV secretory pathway VirB4 component